MGDTNQPEPVAEQKPALASVRSSTSATTASHYTPPSTSYSGSYGTQDSMPSYTPPPAPEGPSTMQMLEESNAQQVYQGNVDRYNETLQNNQNMYNQSSGSSGGFGYVSDGGGYNGGGYTGGNSE
jgi:hypothetical protein